MDEYPPHDHHKSTGQRRVMTLLFSDLAGSTNLSQLMEPENNRAMLDALRDVFHRAADQNGGRVVSVQGDGALIAFGVDGVTEQDALHATNAALDIHDALHALTPIGAPAELLPLQAHSGIHSGVLLMADGDIERGLFDVRGAVANVAGTLAKLARPGQLLITPGTLGRYHSHFVLAPPLTLRHGQRGDDDSTWQVLSVLGRRAERIEVGAVASDERLPYIERDDAVQHLLNFATHRDAHRPRCLIVQAEAGMGKSRLLRQFARLAKLQGMLLYLGDCERSPAAEVLQPFAQMLGTVQATPELADAATIPDRVRQRLLGSGGVVVIDDWQWADDASRRLLDELLASGTQLHAVLACRPRSDGLAWISDAESIFLRPFDRAESEAAMLRLLPDANPFERRRIHAEAGGVPLFIEELCHMPAQRKPQLPGIGPRVTGVGPHGWLQGLVVSRLERLPPEAAAMVRAAAVIGVRAPLSLVQAALGRMPGLDDQAHAAQADLLHPHASGAALRFKHGLTRAAVYEAIGLSERRLMHGRVARYLSASTPADRLHEVSEALSYHFTGADIPDEAASFAEMAGIKAMSVSAVDRAKAQFRLALSLLDTLSDTPERYRRWRSVVRRMGFVSLFDPGPEEPGLFDQAARLAHRHDDRSGAAYAGYWAAYVHYARGNIRQSLAAGRRAIALADELADVALAHQTRVTLGQALAAAGQYDQAMPLLLTVRPLKRPAHAETDAALRQRAPAVAYALACQAAAWGDQGRFDEAAGCFEQALQAVPWPGHEVEGSVLCWRAAVDLWRGDAEAAVQHAQSALRIGERVRSLYIFGMGSCLRAMAQWQLDPQPDIASELQHSTGWLLREGKHLSASLSTGWLAHMACELGRPVEVRRHAARALSRLRQGDAFGAPRALRALARSALQQQQPERAHRWLLRAEQVTAARQSGHEAVHNHLAWAQWLAQAGRTQEAHQRAAAASHQALSLGMRLPHGERG